MKNRARAALLFAFLATVLAMFGRTALAPFDGKIYDIGITTAKTAPPPNFTILGIDENFMRGRHAYLAPRDRLAKLVEVVATGKPKVIVLDVWLDSRIDEKSDRLLRDALLQAKKSGVAIFLSDVDVNEKQNLSGVTAHGSVLPFFRDAATATGAVNFDPDSDNVVRNIRREKNLSLMPFLAARAAQNAQITPENRRAFQILRARLKSENTPIDWRGAPGAIPITPAAAYLQQPFLAAMLAEKTIFIGATYPRSYDVFQTPYAYQNLPRPMYGVEVLAHATATISRLAPRHSHETSVARWQTFIAVFLIALLLCLAALRSAPLGIGLTTIAVIGAVVFAMLSARAPLAIAGLRYWPASAFLIAAPVSCGLGVALRQWQQARELKLVRDAFGAYVGPEVLEQMGGKMPELGGEMRRIAVLFCDIRGYSALAESLQNDPSKLMSELNAHFEPLVAALKKRGAYADNYVGDLVMALFGAPVSQTFEKDVQNSVLAALDFVRLVGERNELRKANGQAPIEVGIGVHCGEAVVGNLGAEGKIHYTAIGDTVNIASRVESSTRKYDAALLVTEEVVQACPDFGWQFVDETQVKGRTAPVRLYRIS